MDLNDRFLSPVGSRNSTNAIRTGTTSTSRSQNAASHPGNSARSYSPLETPHTSAARSRSNNSDFQPGNSERSNLDRTIGQEISFTDDEDGTDNDKKLANAVWTRLTELRTLKNYCEGEISNLTNEIDSLKQKIFNTQKLFREFIRDLQDKCPELFDDVDEVDGHIDS
jgi:hypothetical protein